jgi:cytochrome c-type biogenesis protein
MAYLVLFLEGIITFISPCLLPLLPVYISYFAGGGGEKGTTKTLINAAGFTAGFSLVFTLLGAFAGTLGRLLQEYRIAFNIATGGAVLFFGLHYLGIFRIGFLNRVYRGRAEVQNLNFFSSLVFGMVFSIGWTPCVGAFLGSALMVAAQSGSALKGVVLLFIYALGMGIPFIISALLIDKLAGAFEWVKRHYRVITFISGGILVLTGILMMTGIFGRFLSSLTIGA